MGQDEAGGLAAQLAQALLGADHARDDLGEVADRQLVLGDFQVLELVREQPADQGHAGADGVRQREGRAADGHLVELEGLAADLIPGREGVVGQFGQAQGQVLLDGHVDQVVDLGVGPVVGRLGAHDVAQGLHGLLAQGRPGAVGIGPVDEAGVAGDAGDLGLEVLHGDQPVFEQDKQEMADDLLVEDGLDGPVVLQPFAPGGVARELGRRLPHRSVLP